MKNTTNKSLKTRCEIAEEYGIHPDTLRNLLLRNEVVLPKGLITPRYQAIIEELISGETNK